MALQAKNLTKRFSLGSASLLRTWLGLTSKSASFTALNQVSFDVPKGEMLGVLGHNGAGKSTLLRTLAGIYSADSGTVSITGDMAGLFELGGLGNTQLSGREYAERYLQFYAVPRSERASLIHDIHQFSELGDYFDERIHRYSAGMAARLFFATATALARDVYLVDEILSVGDEHFQVKSWARMRERLASGASGVLVTHDWSAVIKLCRSACVLKSGALVQHGASDAVIADYLKLPTPSADKAEIIAPSVFHASGDSPLSLSFEVVVKDDIDVECNASLEYLLLGVGWEIITITQPTLVGTGRGRYRVTIALPQLQLRAGEYSINLFLRTANGTPSTLHCLSWTYGNGSSLRIEGASGEDIAPFPIAWSVAA